MNDSTKKKLVDDIETRLDTFFSQSDKDSINHSPKESLEKLKSIILNIDWEITDECLSDLINETNRLLPKFEPDRMVHALLRMLQALGQYTRKRKAQSHPDTIKRILSVFESLEQFTNNANLDEELKKRIIIREIDAFNQLKQQIDKRRPTDDEHRIKASSFVDQQKLEHAMSVVEKKLQLEVDALKKKLYDIQQEIAVLRK